MLATSELSTLADFFLDGAKIIFGSLVVGVFVPNASGSVPWLTFLGGLMITILFLAVAAKLENLSED